MLQSIIKSRSNTLSDLLLNYILLHSLARVLRHFSSFFAAAGWLAAALYLSLLDAKQASARATTMSLCVCGLG